MAKVTMSHNSDARTYFHQRRQQQYAQREREREKWLRRVREAIQRHAPRYSDIRQVYIFGSLVKSGLFRISSDIDIAIDCDTQETESAFWRSLEQTLRRDVDLRPLQEPLTAVIPFNGELVYERSNPHPVHQYST